ncbi:uncharacterized protein LOC120534210 isoform X2 [Polypterus senegalus]|uniref:uncharacterized protein LOC120534210 isoform X2 n=1 Tax=Polypterus senegalus TaxID=55291 RepID=UPI001964D7C4|nr:uncharacterized protein LOC120534210 isoform X2 [Polypterus senegalus]
MYPLFWMEITESKHQIPMWTFLEYSSMKKLKEEDQCTGDFLDKSLLQFCFMKLLQEELNCVSHLWNMHRIRPQRNSNSPHGKPFIMYTVPHLYGAEDNFCPCSVQDIEVCEEECQTRQYPCDQTVFELCCLLMTELQLDPPDKAEEATYLYISLREQIRSSL